MDDFVNTAGDRLLSGIPAKYWRRFLKMFTESATEARVERIMEGLSKELAATWKGSDGQRDELLQHFKQTARLVASGVVAR